MLSPMEAHLDWLHGSKRTKQLPQHILLGFGRQIVNENAPAGAGDGIALDHAIGDQVAGQRWVARDYRAKG